MARPLKKADVNGVSADRRYPPYTHGTFARVPLSRRRKQRTMGMKEARSWT
jgi:hypothetical protein